MLNFHFGKFSQYPKLFIRSKSTYLINRPLTSLRRIYRVAAVERLNKVANYDKKDYWNDRYEKEQEKFEWCRDYSVLKPLISKTIKYEDSILMIGCGNSQLSNSMYQDGYHNITNIDYSSVVIEKMSQLYPHMKWKVNDMLNLTLPAETFDIIIEKATLDVLFVKEKSPWQTSETVTDKMNKVLHSFHSILKPTGKFISITFTQPHFRRRFYEQYWSKCNYDTFGDGFHYYFYTSEEKRTIMQNDIINGNLDKS